MSMSSSTLSSQPNYLPPTQSRLTLPLLPDGSGKIDKSKWNKTINVWAVKYIADPQQLGKIMSDRALQKFRTNKSSLRTYETIENGKGKLIFLDYSADSTLPEEVTAFLSSTYPSATLEKQTMNLSYDDWNYEEILKSILPESEFKEVPTSFTLTGHLAHFNLREEFLPYKKMIGEILLTKVASLKTVVNKVSTINAQFRYFPLEVLAGEDDTVVRTTESNCSFQFDFSKVYWNSRLSYEHDRIISLIMTDPMSSGAEPGQEEKRGEGVVCDPFAGVGPFVVPAAKKGSVVLANDLNPESTKWMEVNRKANKVEHRLRITTLDARHYIRSSTLEIYNNPFPQSAYEAPLSNNARRQVVLPSFTSTSPEAKTPEQQALEDEIVSVGEQIRTLKLNKEAFGPQLVTLKSLKAKLATLPSSPASTPIDRRFITHYIMNLPDSAITFLDSYRGLLTPLIGVDGLTKESLECRRPMVHCYCFTKCTDSPESSERDILERASYYLGTTLSATSSDYNLHLVRCVAPNKDMYCLSFRLPSAVAFGERTWAEARKVASEEEKTDGYGSD